MQVAVLTRFSWNSHSWCGSTHGWTLLFLETIGPTEPHIWRKCAPKTSLSGLSQTVWGFSREKLKNCIWYPIYQKEGYINFCCPTPRSLKNIDATKNNFSLIFWKILFFSKKLLDKKYSKRRCLRRKRLYWFLSPGAPLPQDGHALPQMGSSQYSPKTLLFSKNLFYKKISVT